MTLHYIATTALIHKNKTFSPTIFSAIFSYNNCYDNTKQMKITSISQPKMTHSPKGSKKTRNDVLIT